MWLLSKTAATAIASSARLAVLVLVETGSSVVLVTVVRGVVTRALS